jgi:hypothetical protein
MRARVPITVGLGAGVSLAMSVTLGQGGTTIVIFCGALISALAFGGWVLSKDDRTERLVLLIRALRGRTTGPTKPGPKQTEPGTKQIEPGTKQVGPGPEQVEPGPKPVRPGPKD